VTAQFRQRIRAHLPDAAIIRFDDARTVVATSEHARNETLDSCDDRGAGLRIESAGDRYRSGRLVMDRQAPLGVQLGFSRQDASGIERCFTAVDQRVQLMGRQSWCHPHKPRFHPIERLRISPRRHPVEHGHDRRRGQRPDRTIVDGRRHVRMPCRCRLAREQRAGSDSLADSHQPYRLSDTAAGGHGDHPPGAAEAMSFRQRVSPEFRPRLARNLGSNGKEGGIHGLSQGPERPVQRN
jgi:hypothetical protein